MCHLIGGQLFSPFISVFFRKYSIPATYYPVSSEVFPAAFLIILMLSLSKLPPTLTVAFLKDDNS
jgi:hypothetical protein